MFLRFTAKTQTRRKNKNSKLMILTAINATSAWKGKNYNQAMQTENVVVITFYMVIC